MKPCSRNRKPLALLATGALETGRGQELRAHLEACPACREYLAQISNVTAKLRAVELNSEIRVSGAFHRRTLAAMNASERKLGIESLRLQLQSLLNWRVAVPALAMVAVAIAVLSPTARQPGAVFVPAPPSPVAVNPNVQSDLAPTVAHYELVANQSLDKLDELITVQGRRSQPSAPGYTASFFPQSGTSD
jgi:anti-sigma factor RsiW